MLKITFKQSEKLNRDIDGYFDNWYKDEWIADPLVQEMIQDVDKTEVKGPYLAISPVFGPIPITKISGGVKALILALKTDRLIYGSACGNNCAEWLIRIGEIKDVNLYLGYPMEFPRDFEAICVDTGASIHNQKDFIYEYLRSRGYF